VPVDDLLRDECEDECDDGRKGNHHRSDYKHPLDYLASQSFPLGFQDHVEERAATISS
jgi:hypothetical protein